MLNKCFVQLWDGPITFLSFLWYFSRETVRNGATWQQGRHHTKTSNNDMRKRMILPLGSGQLGSGKKKRLSFSQSQGHSPSEVCFFSAIQFESSSDTMNPFLIVKCKSLDVISICQFSQLYAFSDLNNFISMSYSTRYFFIKTPEKYQL